LNDHVELSPKAKEIIDQHIVEVPVEVLCEVIYVLTGHYEIDRKNVSMELKRFFKQTQCSIPNRKVILRGLDYFSEHSLDFVDCILAAYSEIEKDEIYTFDNQLQRLIIKIKKSTP
jgi:predicted nucleic-acid-binding protein